jgi:hypothetical protein
VAAGTSLKQLRQKAYWRARRQRAEKELDRAKKLEAQVSPAANRSLAR